MYLHSIMKIQKRMGMNGMAQPLQPLEDLAEKMIEEAVAFIIKRLLKLFEEKEKTKEKEAKQDKSDPLPRKPQKGSNKKSVRGEIESLKREIEQLKKATEEVKELYKKEAIDSILENLDNLPANQQKKWNTPEVHKRDLDTIKRQLTQSSTAFIPSIKANAHSEIQKDLVKDTNIRLKIEIVSKAEYQIKALESTRDYLDQNQDKDIKLDQLEQKVKFDLSVAIDLSRNSRDEREITETQSITETMIER